MIAKVLTLLMFAWIGLGKLTYLATVFRHGARYPVSDMFDGNATKEFHGKLTSVGMRQHYLLGTYMRADYIVGQKLINATLYPKQVEVFTDSSERCVESALCHVLGMFPFGSGATLPDGISQEMLQPPFESFLRPALRSENQNSEFAMREGFQPVPVKNASSFFPACPNQDFIIAKQMERMARELTEFQLEQAPFTDKMRLLFNLSAEEANVGGLALLYDVITCDKYLGRDIPSAFTDSDYKQLTYIQNYLITLAYSGQSGKVFSTSVLGGILDNMDNRVKNGKEEVMKYSVYSGHDTNVMPILTTLNLTTPGCLSKAFRNETVDNCAHPPPFAASLVFELHEDDEHEGQYFVKVRYNGIYYKICGGLQQCPYEEFASRIRKGFVNVGKECGWKSTIQQQ